MIISQENMLIVKSTLLSVIICFCWLQKYHRDILERLAAPVAFALSPPLQRVHETSSEKVARRGPGKHVKERRPGSRRHRKVVAGDRDTQT